MERSEAVWQVIGVLSVEPRLWTCEGVIWDMINAVGIIDDRLEDRVQAAPEGAVS